MGCTTALTSSQAGPRTQPSHSPGPRAQEARALPPPGCSLSHEQDSQVTGQGCPAASKAGLLQELGPGSFLCGGRRGSGSGLLSLAPAQRPPHTPPGSGAHTVMSPRKRPQPSSFLIYSFAEASHSGSLEAAWLPGPVRRARGEGWRRLPLADPESGKAGKPGGGRRGRFPSTRWFSHQLQPAFQPGWELVRVPQKAPVGAEAYLEQARCLCQGAHTLVAQPLPSPASQASSRSSSRLSASARTFSPSWAGPGRQRPPGGLGGRTGLMSGSERTRGESGSGGRSCQASETHLC